MHINAKLYRQVADADNFSSNPLLLAKREIRPSLWAIRYEWETGGGVGESDQGKKYSFMIRAEVNGNDIYSRVWYQPARVKLKRTRCKHAYLFVGKILRSYLGALLKK